MKIGNRIVNAIERTRARLQLDRAHRRIRTMVDDLVQRERDHACRRAALDQRASELSDALAKMPVIERVPILAALVADDEALIFEARALARERETFEEALRPQLRVVRGGERSE